MGRNDKELARALGIRARQEGLGCDSLLDNPSMRELCAGRDWRGVKMLAGAFIHGWQLQDRGSATGRASRATGAGGKSPRRRHSGIWTAIELVG